jgi:hypothetical protein
MPVCSRFPLSLLPISDAVHLGVYFEANGHGTVLLSPSAREQIDALKHGDSGVLARLRALPDLANQAIGDGVADMVRSVECVFDSFLVSYRQDMNSCW